MPTKVVVDSPICDHQTTVEAELKGDEVNFKITSSCRSIQTYASRLTSLKSDELTDFQGSKVLELAGETGLTVTCLVPVAVFNAAWIEMGMISRRLALEKKHACIRFIE